MSPGSRSGRGAMTLTPAPNGAKEFNVAFNVVAGIEHGALDACPLRSSSRSARLGWCGLLGAVSRGKKARGVARKNIKSLGAVPGSQDPCSWGPFTDLF